MLDITLTFRGFGIDSTRRRHADFATEEGGQSAFTHARLAG